MKLQILLAVFLWFSSYCLLINKVVVFAVKTVEVATSGNKNKEQEAHLKVKSRQANKNAKQSTSRREERKLVRKVLSGNDAQLNQSPKEIDLNKSPPRETEDAFARFTIFESSSIGNGNFNHKHHEQNVKIDRAQLLEWSKGKAQGWRQEQAKKQKKKDPIVRKAQYKKWRENREKRLRDGPPANLAAFRETRNTAAKRYRQRRKAKMQSSPVKNTQEHDS